MPRRLRPLLLFLLLGLLKLPVEESVVKGLREQRLLAAPLDLGLRENLSQMSFAASLGGLRSLVASVTYLQAYGAFEDVNWGKVDSLFAITTQLQPMEPVYWDEAAWHQAYNAASFYLRQPDLKKFMKDKLFRDHVQRGINILNEGLLYLPDNPKLLVKLADIHKERVGDHAKAGEYYLEAAKHGAKDYYERFGAYEFARTNDPVLLRRAYDILKRAYDSNKKSYDTERFRSTLMRDLPLLEERLQIPANERIKPDRSAQSQLSPRPPLSR